MLAHLKRGVVLRDPDERAGQPTRIAFAGVTRDDCPRDDTGHAGAPREAACRPALRDVDRRPAQHPREPHTRQPRVVEAAAADQPGDPAARSATRARGRCRGGGWPPVVETLWN